MKIPGHHLEPFFLDAGSAMRIEDVALLYQKLTGKTASKEEMARACQLLDIDFPSEHEPSNSRLPSHS